MQTPTPTAAAKPAQHTPGPWRWNGNQLEPEHRRPDLQHVHTIMDYGYGGHGYLGSKLTDVLAEQDANLRLIAAAPDLLAVCQRLAESAEYWSEYDVPLGIVFDLQAAIGKATGGGEMTAPNSYLPATWRCTLPPDANTGNQCIAFDLYTGTTVRLCLSSRAVRDLLETLAHPAAPAKVQVAIDGTGPAFTLDEGRLEALPSPGNDLQQLRAKVLVHTAAGKLQQAALLVDEPLRSAFLAAASNLPTLD